MPAIDYTFNRDLIYVDENGVETPIYPTTTGSGVAFINNNKKGEYGASALPAGSQTMQDIVDNLGPIAFKTKVEKEDISQVITTRTDIEEKGYVPDATVIAEMYSHMEEMQDHIDDLLYEMIKINSFTINPSIAEKGSIITSATFAYSMNKKPETLRLDGSNINIDTSNGSVTRTGLNMYTTKTWTLVATDERNASATKTVTIPFVNRIWWTVSTDPGSYTSAWVRGLGDGELSDTRAREITLTASANQYIYYILPTRLGNIAFNVGGFDGGFTRVATINVTNASQFTEQYAIWKSDNPNLGRCTIKILNA